LRAAAEGLAARLDPARILVIAVARIGDTLMITPALRALAARWPKAEITFLGHPKRVEVVEHLPFLAAVGPISKQRALWQGWVPGKRWDLALVFGFDEPLVAYALRTASQVVAFRQNDEKLNKRLLLAVESPPYQSDHAIPMRLALTRALGVPEVKLQRKMIRPRESAVGNENIATPAGAATIMARLARCELPVSKERCADVRRLLEIPKGGPIEASVPEGVRVAWKPGDIEGVNTAWGLVDLPGRPYVVVGMVNYSDADEGLRALRRVADAAYGYFHVLARSTPYGARVPLEVIPK